MVKGRLAKGGAYSYTFATLADVLAIVRPILAVHGLALTQTVATDLETGTLTVATQLLHSSGERFDGGTITWPLPTDPQAAGSLISYLRRYAIVALLGIAGADDDDDATTATPKPAPSRGRAGPRMVSAAQLKALNTLMTKAGIDKDARHGIASDLIDRPVTSGKDLLADEASGLIDGLRQVVDGDARLETDPTRPPRDRRRRT